MSAMARARRDHPRHICPCCGSVQVAAGKALARCRACGHAAPRFPVATDPVPEPADWDGRKRVAGQVLKCRGAP